MNEPESKPQQGSYLSIVLAGLLALGIFVILFFLTLGAAAPMVAIAAGVFGLAFFHYVVWGWWLSKLIRDEAEEEEVR